MSDVTVGLPTPQPPVTALEIEKVTQFQLGAMKVTPSGKRGQHPKQHGCVVAEFEVLADIPVRYKIGLFANAGRYKAYVRFSNGKQNDDRTGDIHGMAIKLVGVPGTKVLEQEALATTHDFILADHPVFFIRDAEEYVAFTGALAKTPPGEQPAEFLKWLVDNGRGEDIPIIAAFRKGHERDSPLDTPYWSEVPYAFGSGDETICRYKATPQAGNMVAPPAKNSPDYLLRAMIDHLTVAGRPAVFDFNVQLRDDATPQVIDRPTVEWDVPFQRVAVITIPPQTFDTPERRRFGENLSYTPWHALHEHRPRGQINEIRKAVYLASSHFRHKVNQTELAEPTDSEE